MNKMFKFGLTACLAAAFVFAGCKKDDDNDKYTVTLSANNAEWGAVAGGGEYAVGTEISIMATANSGYHFEKWSDDDTNNPRTLTVTKNIALIAVFAEGNGGGSSVNGGNSGNNNSGNNGNATGDILPKKVAKIVENEDGDINTYLFDTDGKLISRTKTRTNNSSYSSLTTYEYIGNAIVRKKDNANEIYDVDAGRIVSSVLTEDGCVYPSTFSYTVDGYLSSVAITYQDDKDFYDNYTFIITNGNIAGYEYMYNDKEQEQPHTGKYNVTYGDKLNNLNVDLTFFIVDFDLYPIPGYYGKRCKNLPSSWVYSSSSHNEVGEYTYTYDGDYLVKVVLVETGDEDDETTWEIFYE